MPTPEEITVWINWLGIGHKPAMEVRSGISPTQPHELSVWVAASKTRRNIGQSVLGTFVPDCVSWKIELGAAGKGVLIVSCVS